MTAAVVTLIILYFMKKHKCDKNLRLGINYKSPAETINKNVLSNLQKIINILQNKACGAVFNYVSNELEKDLKDEQFPTCAEIRTEIDNALSSLPNEVDEELKKLIKSIYNEIINGLCDSSGKIDIAVLTKLLKDLHSSTCYAEW